MIIENLIKAAFAVEAENTTKIAGLTSPHDPFHGASFRTDDEIDGEWVKPHRVEIVETAESDSTKIIKCRIVGVTTEPPCSGVEDGYIVVGTETFTIPSSYGCLDVVVKTINGRKQFIACDPIAWEIVDETTEEFSVVLKIKDLEDGTRGWCLASAFPGRPGTNAAERFEEGAYIVPDDDLVEGFVNGKVVEFADGDFDHVMTIVTVAPEL